MDFAWAVAVAAVLLVVMLGIVGVMLWFLGRAIWLLVRAHPAARRAVLEGRLAHYRQRYKDEQNPITTRELAEMDRLHDRLRITRREKPSAALDDVLGAVSRAVGATPEQLTEVLEPHGRNGTRPS